MSNQNNPNPKPSKVPPPPPPPKPPAPKNNQMIEHSGPKNVQGGEELNKK